MRLSLDEHQSRVLSRIDELEAQVTAVTQARRGEFDDDEHDPEGVTLSSQWSMLSGLLETVRTEQRRLVAAQERLADGSFGVCDRCGAPIPLAQLEARPWRERCVECSQ